ncbi:serine hydrolase [Hyphococcus sp.]|uniref:serine hydrolase n=1 Tax=Hyphococcus sp. TaxID=2038636 RepID=UPI003CCBA674
MRFFLFAVFLLQVLVFPSFAQEPPDPAPTTPVDLVELPSFEPTREEAVLEGYIDGVVAAHMREHGTPGATVSVVRNGKTLFAKGYGVADAAGERPVDGGATLFRIGSVSKTFIWTAAMMLHERGLLDLDEDVNAYLKDIRIRDAFGAPVTMNHLMAHRAGFEDAFGVYTRSDADDTSLTDALNETMPERVYPPGARTSYSNWGAALAAKIVEDVSGVSYNQFLQTEILDPLGMADTTLNAPSQMQQRLRENLAEGVKTERGGYETADYMGLGPFAPAGAMSSTARDMARWMMFHLGGGVVDGVRLLSPATHQLMASRAFDDRAAGADMAHGFQSNIYKGVETFGHGGATTVFYTNMILIPDLETGIFISQNSTSDRTLVNEIPVLLIDHLYKEQNQQTTMAARSSVDAVQYTGRYLSNRRSFSKFEKLYSLPDVYSVSATDGALLIASGEKALRYGPVAGASDTFENRRGERVVFTRDESGRVAALSDASSVHSYERAGIFGDGGVLIASLAASLFFGATTLAGAWRRHGRMHANTKLGVWLNKGDILAAIVVFVFAGLLAASIAAMGFTSGALSDYPPRAITGLRIAGLMLFASAVALVISAPFAWMRSGWSVWRKAHHTGFVLSLAALAVMLVAWRVIFSGTA